MSLYTSTSTNPDGNLLVIGSETFTPIVDVLTKPEWSHYRDLLYLFFKSMENTKQEFFTITPFDHGVVLDAIGFDKNMYRQKDTLYVDGIVTDAYGIKFFRVRLITRTSDGTIDPYETSHGLDDTVLLPAEIINDYYVLFRAILVARMSDNIRNEFGEEGTVKDYQYFFTGSMKAISYALPAIKEMFSRSLPKYKPEIDIEIEINGKPYFNISVVLNKKEEVCVELIPISETHLRVKMFLLSDGVERFLIQTNKDYRNLKGTNNILPGVVTLYTKIMVEQNDDRERLKLIDEMRSSNFVKLLD